MCIASDDAQAIGTSWRRQHGTVLCKSNAAGSSQFTADFTSFDADGFTITWTTNDATAYIIHYLAIGGSDLTNAKAVSWQMPTTATTKAVAGVGFVPDCVLTFHVADIGTGALPSNAQSAGWGLGVMTTAGQWCTSIYTEDGVGTTDTYRNQRTDAMLVSSSVTGTELLRAAYTSMDADGFTTTFATVDGTAHRLFSLCLKGGQYKVGASNKPTSGAPASQVVSGVGFLPTGYLLASHQTTSGTAIAAHARLGLGASDGTAEQSAAFSDTDALADTSVDAVDKTDKVFVVVDNDTASVDAEADHSSLDADGFTLSWSTNHATATQMLYLAMGNSAGGGGAVQQQLTMMGIGN